jgi:hypothetical protein
MSDITDNTTTIGTTWTENTIPAFTAGTLTTLAACISEVESKLQRGTLSTSTSPTLAQTQNWMERKKMEVAEAFGFSFNRKYAYVTLVSGQYRYSLPPDFAGIKTLVDTTNNRDITIGSEAQYDLVLPDPSDEQSGRVEFACVKNMELWLAYPPDSADTLQLEYDRSGAETTADDYGWLPELMRYRCCDGAIAEAFEAIHMWRESDRYAAKFEMGLAKAKKAEGRRKWKGKNISAMNVFQAHNAKHFQAVN